MKTHFTQSIVLSLLLATGALCNAHAADRAGLHGMDKVNLNTADAVTIDRVLLNVGPSKAEAIVAYRKEHGSFKSAEQLALVKGIGLKTVEKNRDRILLGGNAAPARQPMAPVTRR
ncbi:ComEA family DNA-binding protein [Cognatiluteimonas profundi]|uniref:ComEA family DNA-binding protein n=1 Tax=Cognatiluteimonas profundi TaxID=2594501 RepID=UPI00131CB2FC|nr:helix-hairpin-helix domain-containing protein [Lysobacter profundi]